MKRRGTNPVFHIAAICRIKDGNRIVAFSARGLFAPAILGVWVLAACTATDPEAIRGEQLFTTFRCSTCHNTTGNPTVTGPSLKGLAGSRVLLDDGTSVIADDAYLRESIVHPNAKVRAGWFSDQMLTVSGGYQKDLENPETVNALVTYIKGAK